MTLASVTRCAGLSSLWPSTTTRPSAIQRSASRREHSPERAIRLAIRSPRSVDSAAASSMSAAGGDEGPEQRLVGRGGAIFGMPLHADAEALGRILDALDDAVGRDRIDDQAAGD